MIKCILEMAKTTKIPKKRKKRSELPQSKDGLDYKPEFSQFSAQVEYRKENPFKQQPALQHELSVEGKKKGLKMSMLHSAQHPLHNLPYDMKVRLKWKEIAGDTMPSMTNYSNLEAPTPMRPKDRPV